MSDLLLDAKQQPRFVGARAGGPLLRVMVLLDRTIAWFESATLVGACTALFVTMLIVFADAVLRYAINSPLKFTADVVTMYLISASLLLVVSDTLRRGGHISVDLFALMLPRRLHHFVMGALLLVAAGVVSVIAHETSLLSWEAWRNNELTVGIYAWPQWLSKAIVAASFLVLGVRLAHVGLSQLIAGVTGNAALAISVTHVADQPAEEGT